jgi:hypothetical protein
LQHEPGRKNSQDCILFEEVLSFTSSIRFKAKTNNHCILTTDNFHKETNCAVIIAIMISGFDCLGANRLRYLEVSKGMALQKNVGHKRPAHPTLPRR